MLLKFTAPVNGRAPFCSTWLSSCIFHKRCLSFLRISNHSFTDVIFKNGLKYSVQNVSNWYNTDGALIYPSNFGLLIWVPITTAATKKAAELGRCSLPHPCSGSFQVLILVKCAQNTSSGHVYCGVSIGLFIREIGTSGGTLMDI